MTAAKAIEENYAVLQLRAAVAARAKAEGRTDTAYPGLRFYRFSNHVDYPKTQLLMPGLVLVLQGVKTVRLRHETLRYDAANYLILGAQTVCLGTVVEATTELPYLAIHIDLPPDLLLKAFVGVAALGAPPVVATVRENTIASLDQGVIEVFTRLIPAIDNQIELHLIVPLLLEELLIRLVQTEAGKSLRDAAAISRNAAQIQRSMQHIQANFHCALAIDELATQSAMSPSHYAHTFRKLSGVSPMRYLRGLRLGKAFDLLRITGARPSEVASLVGYDSIEHFTREFKRHFGLSPAEHAKQNKLMTESKFAESVN